MKLVESTWLEVEAYLKHSSGIIIPCGSTEQHGPMGLIGTDALCAELIAQQVADNTSAMMAPTLFYTPAPFNTAFPGTLSISVEVFEAMVDEILQCLLPQGFRSIYFLNGHGANIAPLKRCAKKYSTGKIRIRNWWDFPAVNALRQAYYGDWEGMHATPSEIAITQTSYRTLPAGLATTPPQALSAEYIASHAGDKHGLPDEHRHQFPDGRVGSHSALAKPEHGKALLAVAVTAVSEDYAGFVN